MAQQTLNAPPVRSPFTTGDSSEKGDTPNDLVTKLQAMLTEVYNSFRLLQKSGVSVPLTGSTSETVLATIPIPANLLGANGQLRIKAQWSCTSSAGTKA